MAQFLVRYDQTGTAELREQMRGEHIAYRKSLGESMLLAGPLLDDTGTPVGSVIILAATDREEAERAARQDPFVREGLLTLRSIEPMRIAMARAAP